MAETDALPELTAQLYQELRHCARRILAEQSGDLTLQATEIVNEACLRLMVSPALLQSRAHVYRSAAKAMRHLLIDHVRSKSAQKRNAKQLRTLWMDELLGDMDINLGLLTIDRTLTELSTINDRLESVAELHYLAGFTQAHIAEALGLGRATVERDLKFVRSFLASRLQQNHD